MPSDGPHPDLSHERCRCRALPAGRGLWQPVGAGATPQRQPVVAARRVSITHGNVAGVGVAIRDDVSVSHGKLVGGTGRNDDHGRRE